MCACACVCLKNIPSYYYLMRHVVKNVKNYLLEKIKMEYIHNLTKTQRKIVLMENIQQVKNRLNAQHLLFCVKLLDRFHYLC